MARKKPEETTVTEANPTTTVAEPPANGQAPTDTNGSTLPSGEKKSPPGDKPVMKFGPFPTSEKRTHLSVAIWKREVTDEKTAEVYAVYNVALSRTYFNGGNEPKTSSTIRASEIPLAVMMLETAARWIDEQKPS